MQNLFTIQTVAIFVVIALPGIIGQVAYALTVSKPIDALQNQLVSIFAFGCLNFVFASWPLIKFVGYPVEPENLTLFGWIVSILVLVLLPLVLGWALARVLKVAVASGLLGFGVDSEWDHAIAWVSRQDVTVWIQVETVEGAAYVGEFDDQAFATSGSSPKGLFFANTWLVDSNGEFDVQMPGIAMLFTENQIARISYRRANNVVD